MLVDTGWNSKEAFVALEQQLKEIGLNFKDITRIVITHFHVDHYGLASKLKQLSGAKIALHQREKDFIDSREFNIDTDQAGQWLRLHGVPEKELLQLQTAFQWIDFSPPSPDLALHEGEKIPFGSFCFELIWTPGHSPGHVCLYEPAKKILLSGDHILPTITPNVSLYPYSADNPLGNYLNSLRAIEPLEVNLILPGHEHIFTGLKQRVAELLQHHEERIAAIIEVIKEEAKTAYEISSKIPWGINGVITPFEEMLPFDKRLAMQETLAHLELLRIEEKVGKAVKDGIVFYNAT